MSVEKIVDVAVGVLIREDGKVLLGSRPEGKPYAGYWEFPGGKIEADETVHQALVRELKEELDIGVADSFPWFVMEHRYEHAHVRLHFRRSYDFVGAGKAREGQEFGFFAPVERTPGLLLPVDQAILNRVDLPDVWDANVDTLTYTVNALHATVVRDKKHRFVGTRIETLDDVMKAVAMDFDFVVVTPEQFELALKDGEPRLPIYVEGVPAANLRDWQNKGAHGVKPC